MVISIQVSEQKTNKKEFIEDFLNNGGYILVLIHSWLLR